MLPEQLRPTGYLGVPGTRPGRNVNLIQLVRYLGRSDEAHRVETAGNGTEDMDETDD